MAWSYTKISLLRTAGISPVLGIDITNNRARIVELNIHGGLWNKYRSTFTVKNYFTVEFGENASDEFKVACISREIQIRGVKTRYASTSIQTLGVRSLITDIPSSITNIQEWIRDNFEKLLKIPVSKNDITFSFEVLSMHEGMQRVEVTFVRNADIEQAQGLLSSLELTALSITAGLRDALNPLLYNSEFMEKDAFNFAYITDNDAVMFDYEKRKRVRTYHVDRNTFDVNTHADLWVDGDVIGVHDKMVRPFSIPSEYMLAVGCALKGCMEELHPVNFRTSALSTKTQDSIDSRIFQRTAILCGIVLCFFLGMQAMGSFIVDKLQTDDESVFIESGVNYSELSILEKQNAALKDELQKNGSFTYRSNIAETLHEIAALTPEGVWLYKLKTDSKTKPTSIIVIAGCTANGDRVSELLKNLGSSRILSDVRLMKSGMPMENDDLGSIRIHIPNPILFEIQASVR